MQIFRCVGVVFSIPNPSRSSTAEMYMGPKFLDPTRPTNFRMNMTLPNPTQVANLG